MTGCAGSPRPWPAEVEDHLRTCAECSVHAEMLVRLASFMHDLPRLAAPPQLEARVHAELSVEGAERRVARGLERLRQLTAPSELDGRIVAAFHAGHREQRVVEQLRALDAQGAPDELGAMVRRDLARGRQVTARSAPPVLARRVDEDLRASFRHRLARRVLGALARKTAPPELRGRVTRELHPRSTARRLVLGLAGALAALLLGWALGGSPRPSELPAGELARIDVPGVRFEVYAEDQPLENLSLTARSLLGGIAGGLLEATPPGARTAAVLRRSPAPRRDDPALHSGAQQSQGGERDARPASEGGGTQASTFISLLSRISTAPVQTRYRGERRVTLVDPLGEAGAQLVLRERVISSGDGRFAIDLLEVSSAPEGSGATSDFFRTMQKGREGFFFRHRDFLLRDLARFHGTYQVRVIGSSIEVAGRSCVNLDVRRAEQPERRYEVAVDVETGLVMRYREFLIASDRLLASVEFETFELNPELDESLLTGGPTEWAEFDPTVGPPEGVTFPLRSPSFVPSGYGLARAAARTGPSEREWVEFVYDDGVEQLFFLHSGTDGDSGDPSPLHRGVIRVSTVGAWTLVEGEVQGTPIVAAGKLDLEELLLLVQSAFE